MALIKIKEEEKYRIIRESVLSGKHIDTDRLENHVEAETLIKLINETELTGKKLEMLVLYTSRYSDKALNHLMNLIPNEERLEIFKRIKNICEHSKDACVNVRKYIKNYYFKTEYAEKKSKESNQLVRDILETIFKESVTYEPINKDLELSTSELIIVFFEYKDNMKKLKALIEDTIIKKIDHIVPSKEYLRDIAIAYATLSVDYKRIELLDFVKYFENNYIEKKVIQSSKNGKLDVLKYDFVYKDENVKLYYVNELNGLYVERREERICSEKFYVYPEEDSEGTRVIVRRDNISPFDLYKEYKSKESYYGSVVKYDWPEFNLDNFIDLSCDPTLTTQEEKYNKTKEIINSNLTLKQLISFNKKTYKKESNK